MILAASFNPRAADRKSFSIVLVFFWMIFTKELPTIVASAPAAMILLMCSGFDIPNPTARGTFPAVNGLTCLMS